MRDRWQVVDWGRVKERMERVYLMGCRVQEME